MEGIRLKCSLDEKQIADRLRYNPEILELQLFAEDLNHPELMIQTIQLLKQKGIRVYLHHPMIYRGRFLDIISSDSWMRDYYDWSCQTLAKICKQENVLCVVHPHYSESECSYFQDSRLRKKVRQRIEQTLANGGEYFLWENTVKGIFSQQNPYLFTELIEPLNLPICLDISHSFIALQGSNPKLQQTLEQAQPYATYYHVVDSMGKTHDSLPLGQGKVDWQMVKPYLQGREYIFEIGLTDHRDCRAMIESATFLKNIEEGAINL